MRLLRTLYDFLPVPLVGLHLPWTQMKPLEEPMSAQHQFTSPEIYGPYLNAPVWPWHVAGWIVSAVFALMFVIARLLA